MAKAKLTPKVLALVAERFKMLSEPARLQILSCLRGGEMTVGDLVDKTSLGQANLSKHLQQLHSAGFVARHKDGLYVRYRLADDRVFELCDIMCGRLEAEVETRRRVLLRSASQ